MLTIRQPPVAVQWGAAPTAYAARDRPGGLVVDDHPPRARLSHPAFLNCSESALGSRTSWRQIGEKAFE